MTSDSTILRRTLAASELSGQAKTSLPALDSGPVATKTWLMATNPRKSFKPLYVGEWMRRLGRYPAEVADKIGYSEGYLSEIISGKKKNPSAQFLTALADELKLPIGDLYTPPPPEAALRNIETLTPAEQATLSKLLGQVKHK